MQSGRTGARLHTAVVHLDGELHFDQASRAAEPVAKPVRQIGDVLRGRVELRLGDVVGIEVLRGRGNGGRGRVTGRVAHVHLRSPPLVSAEVYPSRGPPREGSGASFRRAGLLDILAGKVRDFIAAMKPSNEATAVADKAEASREEVLARLRAELDEELSVLSRPDAAEKLRRAFNATPEEIAEAAN